MLSSAAPFSFCLQSFPASESFPIDWLFTSGGQSIEASVSASIHPRNIPGWFLLDWLVGSPCSPKGLSEVFSSTTVQKHQFFGTQHSLWSNSHMCTWLLKKTLALNICTLVSKVITLLFNMLSRFVIAFLPRSNRLLISWLQSLSAVILEPKKIKSVTASTFSP